MWLARRISDSVGEIVVMGSSVDRRSSMTGKSYDGYDG